MTNKYHIYEDTDDGRPVFLIIETGTGDCLDDYVSRANAERALKELVEDDAETEGWLKTQNRMTTL